MSEQPASAEEKQPKVNYAVIDIGSNSVRMLIFRRDKQGKLFQVNRSLRYTKLGQDVSKTGRLAPDAINRSLEALDEFRGIAADYDVQGIYAFGTSALRDASNSKRFIDEAMARTGIQVHVIPGAQEAEYGFGGVAQCFNGDILVFDIGGYSTELTYGNESIEFADSLRLGHVRCTEEFVKQDPAGDKATDELYHQAYAMFRKALAGLDLAEQARLVGIGGTVTTLACLVQDLEIYDSGRVQGCVISRAQIKALLSVFKNASFEERVNLLKVSEKRADTITAGIVLVLALLDAAKRDSFVVCDFDNLEGAAWKNFFEPVQ